MDMTGELCVSPTADCVFARILDVGKTKRNQLQLLPSVFDVKLSIVLS